MYKRNYSSFRKNIVEEIFEIRSCIEILGMISKSTQLISECSTVNRRDILGNLHPLRGVSGLDMYNLVGGTQ